MTPTLALAGFLGGYIGWVQLQRSAGYSSSFAEPFLQNASRNSDFEEQRNVSRPFVPRFAQALSPRNSPCSLRNTVPENLRRVLPNGSPHKRAIISYKRYLRKLTCEDLFKYISSLEPRVICQTVDYQALPSASFVNS